jgi:putative DNA primase/helicase
MRDENNDLGSPLTPTDYANLERCFISREVADSAGMFRVTSEEGKQIVGRCDADDYSGIVIPSVWPGEKGARSHCLRRDNPPFEIKDGIRKEKEKYVLAPGSRNMLYFHPLTDSDLLNDPRVPIFVLEGQKKTLAMFRLSWEADREHADKPLFIPCGINGVYGWRGVIGKTENANGERVPEKGPIPDLAKIDWRGRKVTLLFDANVISNQKVARARNELAQEFADRGAEVWLIDLPQEENVNGIDDYLGRHGAEAGIKLFQSARLFDPKKRLANLHYTDHGHEQAFELLFGNDYLFNWTSKKWLHWNGTCWETDETLTVDRAMLEVAAARLQAASLLSDSTAETTPHVSRKKAIAEAMRLESARGRRAALESAKSNLRFGRRAADFDGSPNLFVCGNGVLDLRSGEFRVGRREDMLTKKAAVNWVPEAHAGRWLTFLEEVFPRRPDMLSFLKRAVGYSLTGLTREEVLFILYGGGRNGKGTFLRVLSTMLGDYAQTTEFSTLIADRDRSRAPRNDIAAMAGRRFVTAQESKEGARLDESLIKTLTGGDLVTARFLHQEFFTFAPSWKIWLATNHKPIIRGSDGGIWSRPKLIPFTVCFEGREDRALKDLLMEPLQLSGILNWAVEGCREYLADGLGYPEEVIQATAEYRAESDLIKRFLDDSCVRAESLQAKARSLYQSFTKWAEETGESKMTETAFGKRMREKGFEKKSTATGNVYLGVGIKSPIAMEG